MLKKGEETGCDCWSSIWVIGFDSQPHLKGLLVFAVRAFVVGAPKVDSNTLSE